MKILLVPNSFKESLSAWQVCLSLEKGIRRVLPAATIYKIPLADGGSGTVEALVRATKGKFFKKRVTGPSGRMVWAAYGVLGNSSKFSRWGNGKGPIGIVEMASASGLHLVPPEKRNPSLTTTFGTGELIKACLARGCRQIMIGLGDSATNDGGVGMAQALGIHFKDKSGREVGRGGGNLRKIDYIDNHNLDKRLKETKIIILSDVQNPLCGPKGAARVFSPQKGAGPEMVQELEKGLVYLSRIIKRDLGVDIKNKPGAGAAGGLGAGLMAFLGAEAASGIGLILKFTSAEDYIKKADLIITGEGKLDRQTIYGKAPMGVAELNQKYKRPLIAVAGTLDRGYELLYRYGFTSLFSIMEGPISLPQALKEAAPLLTRTAERLTRLFLQASRH